MIFALGDNRQLALCALRGAERPPESGLPKELPHVAFGVLAACELAAWKRPPAARERRDPMAAELVGDWIARAGE